MNNSVAEIIDKILKHTDAAVRDDVARYLRACQFTSPDDPMLNGLAVQAALAGQPVRLAQAGGAQVATEAGLARLGDRFEATAWSLARLRVGTIFLACLLSFGMGAGGVAVAFKLWSNSLADVFDLPRASDARLTTLGEFGAVLHVEQQKDTAYVYIDGRVQPALGTSKGGKNYLYFQRP
jgi:hypothetical protein